MSRAEERLLVGLHRRSVREERGMFLAEGVRVVEELAASALALRLAVTSPSLEETERGRALIRLLAERCQSRRVPDHVIQRLAGTDSPQGVIVAALKPTPSLGSLETPPRAALLLLDGVQDPGNFGTLVRSADAFGVAAVLALEGTVDPWNPKSVRSAAGSSFRVPIVPAATGPVLAWLKSERFAIFAAATGGTPVSLIDPPDRFALVVGNEGAGVSDTLMQAADASVGVPIRGAAESLNVAVAAGILLYVLTRRD